MWLAPTGHPVAVIFLSMEHPAVRTDGGGVGSEVQASAGTPIHPRSPFYFLHDSVLTECSYEFCSTWHQLDALLDCAGSLAWSLVGGSLVRVGPLHLGTSGLSLFTWPLCTIPSGGHPSSMAKLSHTWVRAPQKTGAEAIRPPCSSSPELAQYHVPAFLLVEASHRPSQTPHGRDCPRLGTCGLLGADSEPSCHGFSNWGFIGI